MGYVPRKDTGINWAEKMSGLGDKVEDAIGTRKREREAFEDVRVENEAIIDEYEAGSVQDFNNLIFNGADGAKEKFYEWNKAASNGEMTQAEYKRRTNTLMSSWTDFSKNAAGFDERNLAMIERQNKKEGSSFERQMNMYAAEDANLKGKEVYWSDSGKGFYVTKDEQGNIIDQEDMHQSQNPGNMIDNRIKLGEEVKVRTANWKDWTQVTKGIDGESATVTNKRLHTEFVTAKNAAISSILVDDRAVVGVLTDNTDEKYEFYRTENDKDAKVAAQLETLRRNYSEAGTMDLFNEAEAKSEIEGRMIEMVKDGQGIYQPAPTEGQKDAAWEIAGDEIEMQTGYKEARTKRYTPKQSNGGGDGNGNKGGDGGYYNYEAMINAFDRGDTGKMGSLNPNYDYSLDRKTWTWTISEPGKMVEGRLIKGGEGKYEKVYEPGRTVATVSKPSELANYIFKYGVKEGEDAASKYQRELEAYRKEFGTVSSEYAEKRKNPNWTKPKPKAYN